MVPHSPPLNFQRVFRKVNVCTCVFASLGEGGSVRLFMKHAHCTAYDIFADKTDRCTNDLHYQYIIEKTRMDCLLLWHLDLLQSLFTHSPFFFYSTLSSALSSTLLTAISNLPSLRIFILRNSDFFF